jgi:TrmH family RNA methyltransferase
MLSKSQQKFVTSLAVKKIRSQEGSFIAEGVKIVDELLRSAINVKQVYALRDWIDTQELVVKNSYQMIEVTESELQRISQLSTPNQVLAVAEIPVYELKPEELSDTLTLVLDDLRDPGNLGTIIRIADWFGIRDIVCSQTSADAWNPKVVQASMGSIARVKVHYTDIAQFISSMGLPVYGAVLEGEDLYTMDLQQKGLIVVGNESKGISAPVLAHVTAKITIPNYSSSNPSGEAESLNAAIATAVICAEFRRRG